MTKLNDRLEQEIITLEKKFKVNLSSDQKRKITQDLSLGGAPSQTYDKLLDTLAYRFKEIVVTMAIIA